MQAQNAYLDYLIDPSFQGVNKLSVLSFENNNNWTSYIRYFLATVEIRDYNAMIDGQIFFDPPVKHDQKTWDNICKIMTSQGDDHTTSCLLDYVYFKNYYKMTAIDLSKQQALDADPKAIQQINSTENLGRYGSTTTFFIIEKAKEAILDFSKGLVKVMWMWPYDLAAACSTILFYFFFINIRWLNITPEM